MNRSTARDREEYRPIDVQEGYDRWAPRYDSTLNPLIKLEEKTTGEFLGEIEGHHVLDMGCGTGRYCVLLARKGALVVGIDSSSRMLEQAREKITPQCHFEVMQASADTLEFPDNHFDLILSAFTLGHIKNIESVFREAVRVLRKGGQMIVSDFHPYWVVSGHNYAEFFDESGEQYHIPIIPHLIEEYWKVFQTVGLSLVALREPQISEKVLDTIPLARHLKGVPMVLVFNLYNR